MTLRCVMSYYCCCKALVAVAVVVFAVKIVFRFAYVVPRTVCRVVCCCRTLPTQTRKEHLCVRWYRVLHIYAPFYFTVRLLPTKLLHQSYSSSFFIATKARTRGLVERTDPSNSPTPAPPAPLIPTVYPPRARARVCRFFPSSRNHSRSRSKRCRRSCLAET